MGRTGWFAIARVLVFVAACAPPAQAQVPFQLSAWVGLGDGTGRHGSLVLEDVVATNDGVQLAWLRSRAWALTGAIETAHVFGTSSGSDSIHLDNVRAQLVMAGVEYTFGPADAPLLVRAAAGVGRILNDRFRYEGPLSTPVRVGPSWDGAVACAGAFGVRIYHSRSISATVTGEALLVTGGGARLTVMPLDIGLTYGAPFDGD